jgi:membrane-bound lytic murein transglycosylase MltF
MKYILPIIFISCISQAKTNYEGLIRQEARRQGLNEELALAVAMVESSMNPTAKGPYGEIGLFQLRPEYAEVAIYNPKDNIREGIRQLIYWSKQCPVKEFVICYNSGKRHPKFPKLHPYYKRVMKALVQR